MLIVSSVIANAQTLKEALYGGKLKTDSGTVIRKGEDLSTKIDTARKKPVEPEKAKPTIAVTDSSIKDLNIQTDPAATEVADKKDNNTATKDNNKIWKEYMDSVISTLNTEVIPSKKLKEGSYFVFIEYEIDTAGQVSILKVAPSPENAFLQQQINERLIYTAPRLNPVLFGNNKPRKVTKKYSFTITKT